MSSVKKSPPGPDAASFAAWLSGALADRGFDMTPQGSGRRRFAALAGISESTVGRILRAAQTPHPGSFRAIAEALSATGRPVTIGHVMVAAGWATAEELGAVEAPRGRLTFDEAADELGIPRTPRARAALRSMTEALRDPHEGEAEQ
ncbi:hypothetical protein ACSMX9_22765 [Streptomyces sp. LE64]|uniref:hypothetical protein n=1 Tax=Streptomyces sp. LE64 TaxID=3448653 RepID=UPI0040432E28